MGNLNFMNMHYDELHPISWNCRHVFRLVLPHDMEIKLFAAQCWIQLMQNYVFIVSSYCQFVTKAMGNHAHKDGS